MPDKTLFVGNVLPPSGHSVEGDPTFDFNTKESKNMDLRGVPIRIEHEPGLAVGHVTKSWVENNGKKWIIGELDNDTLESNYANHAITPDSRGHTLYKGLSLQHVHTQFSDGNTSKRPVEISICTEPRRPDCYIRSVSKRKKNDYIAHKASIISKPMTDTIQPPQTSQPETTSSTVINETSSVQPMVSSDDNTTSAVTTDTTAPSAPMDRDQLMQLVMEQEGENQKYKKQLEDMEGKFTQMQEKWNTREANEQLAVSSKAEALSKALVESWERSLPKDVMTNENKKAIYALASKFPQESVKMMEIAHKASAKHKQTEAELARERAGVERKLLEQQVAGVLNKRVRPVETTQHKASFKKQRVDEVNNSNAYNPFTYSQSALSSSARNIQHRKPQLFAALKNFGSGNAHSHMDAVYKMRQNL
jgi:hypothetical protein